SLGVRRPATLELDEPDARIGHVRICGSPGRQLPGRPGPFTKDVVLVPGSSPTKGAPAGGRTRGDYTEILTRIKLTHEQSPPRPLQIAPTRHLPFICLTPLLLN